MLISNENFKYALVHKDNYDFLGWSTTKDDTQAEVTAESKWPIYGSG